MNRQVFLALTSGAQWTLLIAIALIIFSWIERKRVYQLSGQLVFVGLALYSVWVISSGIIIVPQVEAGAPAPPEAKALTFFMGMAALGVVALSGLVLHWLKPNLSKIPNLILVPVGILLFFMIYHLQRL